MRITHFLAFVRKKIMKNNSVLHKKNNKRQFFKNIVFFNANAISEINSSSYLGQTNKFDEILLLSHREYYSSTQYHLANVTVTIKFVLARRRHPIPSCPRSSFYPALVNLKTGCTSDRRLSPKNICSTKEIYYLKHIYSLAERQDRINNKYNT